MIDNLLMEEKFASSLDQNGYEAERFSTAFRQFVAEAQRLVLDPSVRVRIAVDGAAFFRIEDHFAEADVFPTPLFRSADPLLVSAGPHLVDPYRPARHRRRPAGASAPPKPTGVLPDGEWAIPPETRSDAEPIDFAAAKTRLSRLLGNIGPSPHLVFWLGSTEMTHDALQRHLRTLNRVLVPRESPVEPQDEGTEDAVIFRHSDGNVLSQVIPALSQGQLARMLGPAETVFFVAPDYPTPSGRMTQKADRPRSTSPGQGMLRLTQSQLDAVDARRLEQTKRLITERLRTALLARDAAIPADLSGKVGRAVEEGRHLGLRSKASYWRWCTIQVPSEGRIGRHTMVRDYMTTSRLSASADERLEHMTVRLRQLLTTAERR